MPRIAHISDLHLLSLDNHPATLARLVAAVERVATEPRPGGGRGVDLIAITGDLFNSSDLDPNEAIPAARDLLDALAEKTGGARTLILPGNHDVRDTGVLGPHSTTLLKTLRDEYASRRNGRVIVHGCDTVELPRLARILPADQHGLPAEVVLLDSSYLPSGRISAGGLIRQEDLLSVAAELGPAKPDRIVVVLLHHHLIPTPVTDLGKIQFPAAWGAARGLAQSVLRSTFAGGDREELTMTAMGAGTALSTLHTLGCPVLVLHGHKHYPTVRLLRGLFDGHGDILLASAGSAGLAEKWSLSDHVDAPDLWPSFNVIDLDADHLRVTALLFENDGDEARVIERPLLDAVRDGAGWKQKPGIADRTPAGPGRRLGLNAAEFTLDDTAGRHWSAGVVRTLSHPSRGEAPKVYKEPVEGAPGAVLREIEDLGGARAEAPRGATLDLRTDGKSKYRLVNGFAGSYAQAVEDERGETSPYEWVGLLNRYGCERARLVLRGLPAGVGRAFGSATDLGSGLARPLSLREGAGGELVLEYAECPPRTLLRIYWPLG